MHSFTVLCSPLSGTAREDRPASVERQQLLTAEDLWTEVSERLRAALNDKTYNTWFSEAEGLELSDEFFVLAVPNDFSREWIESHFLGLIDAAVRDATGEQRRIDLSVRHIETDEAGNEVQQLQVQVEEPSRVEGLNERYNFDSFVIGSSNRFAHAAALAVAEAPAQAYNPLFIYGSTGLGKTHLLQAIGQYVGEHSRDLSVCYVTSERFMNDFINSLRDKRIEGFKQRYRTFGVLLIDDIQFLEHKERIQEEFFHTFNTLYEAGKQIIISSDRPPRQIATLEQRLRSRFEWGLMTDIQPPDLETRIAILQKKVRADGIDVADPQLLTFIAGRVSTNIRELEGALTRVVAFSSLTGRPMTVDLAQDVLRDVFPQGEAAQVTIERIQDEVSERFALSKEELVGDRRSQNIVYPRQVAMYLSRELTDSSLPRIGRHFGGRDHTTVIHATSKIARLIREDRSVYNLVQELTARIKQAG
jgi:chromosomal replication initiator protein